MDKNKKNCNGYESMFLFLGEEDFHNHLQECESCAIEHERMQRVSALIQEAKPYIKKEKANKIIKAACALFVIFFAGLMIPVFTATTDLIAMNLSTAEELGLPVDEYGLILAE